MLLSTTAKHALAPVSSMGIWSPSGNSLSTMYRGIVISTFLQVACAGWDCGFALKPAELPKLRADIA
jgi:hypothetical protein